MHDSKIYLYVSHIISDTLHSCVLYLPLVSGSNTHPPFAFSSPALSTLSPICCALPRYVPRQQDSETLQQLCEIAEDDSKDVRELKHFLERPNVRECLNLQESTGFTPLLYAALSCNAGKIQVLLDAKANLFVLEARGWSVLHFAAKSSSRQATEAVRILLEAGADSIIDVQVRITTLKHAINDPIMRYFH